MNNFNINNILACPDCSEELITNEAVNGEGKREKGEGNDFELLCRNCKAMFEVKNSIPVLLPLTTDSQGMKYIEHYEKDAELFDYFESRECQATEHEERRLREYIVSKIPPECNVVLDVGSGGAWLSDVFDYNKHNLISFDISKKNITQTLKAQSNENHFGVVGDALNPPFIKNSIDCIVASEIIEHLTKPNDFVNKMINILAPGGHLIISTPYKEVIPQYLCIHCNQMTPKNAHLHSFDEKKLTSLFDMNTGSIRYFIFGNKALTVLRTHVLLQFLPFLLWKFIDKIANLILKKPAHIIIVYQKKK